MMLRHVDVRCALKTEELYLLEDRFQLSKQEGPAARTQREMNIKLKKKPLHKSVPASETKPRLHALRAKASKNKKNVNFTKIFASLTRDAPAAQTAYRSIGELIIINFAKKKLLEKSSSIFFNFLMFLKRSQHS